MTFRAAPLEFLWTTMSILWFQRLHYFLAYLTSSGYWKINILFFISILRKTCRLIHGQDLFYGQFFFSVRLFFVIQSKMWQKIIPDQLSDWSITVILFEINCAIFYSNLHLHFCQFVSWTNWTIAEYHVKVWLIWKNLTTIS